MNLKTEFVYKFNRLLNKFFKLKILDTSSTIQYLIQTGESVARFGDGEMNIIMGGDIHFQKYDVDLSIKLKNILSNKNKKLNIGIPLAINTVKGYKKDVADFWNMNMDTGRMHWLRFCSFHKTYLNASFTRCYYDYENKDDSTIWFANIIQLWRDKTILIIEGADSKLGVGNSLFSNSKKINRIIVPSENAWSHYDNILLRTKSNASDFDLILASIGPTATILAHDMVDFCKQIIDIGHLNMEYKCYLENGGKEINNTIISDEQYLSQIIETIV